jgi:serine/threonine protein kinase
MPDQVSIDQNSLKEIEKMLFDGALNLPDPDVRAAFLDQSCRGNPPLRMRLENLLAAESLARGFFDINLLEVVGESLPEEPNPQSQQQFNALQERDFENLDDANARIGRYKLIRRIGDGGCGVVYAARQQEPVQREVALKIIRLGMDTERVIARFDVERRALALMNHPNIAHVLDAGATAAGRPYFVMELVPGTKITEYCDNQRLKIEDRLMLFVQVCMAIQHAHQKGILHLDIKPSNVLITLSDNAPVPKVIDFGIGKAIEAPLADGFAATAPDHFIGTPAYMSPEQVAGAEADVDTQSDIYSLGALLYELLTGRPPFDSATLVGLGADEMRRVLRDWESPLPSVLLSSLTPRDLAVVAEQRDVGSSTMIGMLCADLDWITQQAMQKNPQRRYATANGLATDIKRYLQNQPISARPPSSLYRMRKFVRRNRLAFVSAVALTMTLIAGLSISTWLFLREREARHHEEVLRAQAEDAEKVSRAVYLVRQHNFEDADKLLKEIKSPLTRPTLDGVSAYRTMGNKLAAQGKWHDAADDFAVLVHIDGLDHWAPVTLDFQACGAVLMECGDLQGYASFRQAAIAEYTKASNGDAEARILKTCLLQAPDKALLDQLQPLADKTEKWFAGLDPKSTLSWAAIPVSLWHYRMGDYTGTTRFALRGYYASDTSSAHNATIRLLLAMAAAQTGQISDAHAQLDLARKTIEDKLSRAPGPGDGKLGFWYDWVFAHVLLREAISLIDR